MAFYVLVVLKDRGRKDNRKLLTRHSRFAMPSQRSKPSTHPLHNDTLVRGVILALIGLTLLVGPHFMGATAAREMFVHVRIPAWFSLVLGTAFMGQYAWMRYQQRARSDT